MLKQQIVELPKKTLLAGAFGGLVALIGAVTVAQDRIENQLNQTCFDIVLPDEWFGP